MVVCTVAGFVVIIVCLVFAFTLTRKTGKRVLETILEPLHAIEDVAMELTEGICTVRWNIIPMMRSENWHTVCGNQFVYWEPM